MKQFNGFQQWCRFLVAHKLVSFAALAFIVVSSLGGSLFVYAAQPTGSSLNHGSLIKPYSTSSSTSSSQKAVDIHPRHGPVGDPPPGQAKPNATNNMTYHGG